MADMGLDITFDEDNRIRVMPKEKFKQTEDLETECHGFAEKIQAFSGTVDMLVEVLDGEAAKIEEEKLRAIGQRNRALALLPSWLLYPFLRILVARLEGRPGALVMWMLVFYAISFGPLLSLYLLQDGHLNWGQFATTFMWPPAQLPDFALGVLASELSAALPSCSGCSGWCRAMLGDAALLGFAAAVVMLPSPSTHAECQTDSNVLLTHGGSLAIALFIFGSAEMEAEARRRKQLSMQAAIQEKTQELERLTFQLNSLERVEREQQVLIEKLSNNETS
eukprot:g8781.t1